MAELARGRRGGRCAGVGGLGRGLETGEIRGMPPARAHKPPMTPAGGAEGPYGRGLLGVTNFGT